MVDNTSDMKIKKGDLVKLNLKYYDVVRRFNILYNPFTFKEINFPTLPDRSLVFFKALNIKPTSNFFFPSVDIKNAGFKITPLKIKYGYDIMAKMYKGNTFVGKFHYEVPLDFFRKLTKEEKKELMPYLC